jgi:predicted metal-dependent HD superfamily phosphohydrolase
MNRTDYLSQVEEYVEHVFKSKEVADNIYHNWNHTKRVVRVVKSIGNATRLEEDDIEILQIAAWFHDIGYIDVSDGHEEKSAEYARNFLAEIEYPRDKIEKVERCILATKVPQNPKSKIEEVICDADLHHLGSEGFFETNELFRVEYEKQINKPVTDMEWYEKNIQFFANHNYFTSYAKDKFGEQKSKHLAKLQKRYRKLTKKEEQDKYHFDKLAIEKKKLENRSLKDKKADRGIETMFRNVMRTHISLSTMADNKANIMISVNTLLITAIVAILARKLDTNPHLIAPTAILTTFSLVTLIYAVLVTRPKVTSGTFTKEDIENKSANLLFFGNFFKMDLEKFTWGMNEMMNNRDYLYGSMIKDFYFLGQVLGQKYRYLRICYNIFMYGLIISVIAFTIAIFAFPESTDLGPILE